MAATAQTVLDSAFDKVLQLAFPPVLVRLIQALLESEPSFTIISDYLSKDPVLAGKVLHAANSMHYAFEQKVVDLRQAATILGTGELFKLVIALTMQKRLDPVFQRQPESMYSDWRLTLWSAIAAERIAARLASDQRQNAYLAAMLKDLPLFLLFCRKEVPPFLNATTMATLPQRFNDEALLWGTSHPDLAHSIFLLWGLPFDVAEAVRLHHDYEGVLTHAPLTRCLIYATRWAELAHARETDTGALIAFEVGLAAMLGFNSEEMDEFRADCATAFTRTLADLGIRQNKAEARFYEQSLSLLQHYYFLALEAVGSGYSFTPASFALTLQRHLQSFWAITDWELFIRQPEDESGSFIRCDDGKLLTEKRIQASPFETVESVPGWQRIAITAGGGCYGYLAVPTAQKESLSGDSLPMFLHVIALHLEGQRKRASSAIVDEFTSIPLAIARVDASCRIKDATSNFLDLFGLSQTPTNITAKGLLDSRLGISLPNWDLMASGKTPFQGWFTLAPEGRLPGTPTYVATYATPNIPGDYYLLVGDVTEVSSMQSLALSNKVYLEAMFSSLSEKICLLDASGSIFWTPDDHSVLKGRNIFSISRPGSPTFKGPWSSDFLSRIIGPTLVQAEMLTGKSAVSFELVFTPVQTAAGRQYLLIVRQQANQAADPLKSCGPDQDTLTGLRAHAGFFIQLEKEVESARQHDLSTGVIYLDIEAFHRVNSLYGYQTGDGILRRVAGSIEAVCRKGSGQAFRYGGDDFTVIVPGATKELMEHIAMALRTQVQACCHGNVDVCMGLALIGPGDAPEACALLAARAVQSAKENEGKFAWAK